MIGNRKLLAVAGLYLTLIGFAAIAAFKLQGGALSGVLENLGSAATMGLLYYCGGNVGEHFSQMGRRKGAPAGSPGEKPTELPGTDVASA